MRSGRSLHVGWDDGGGGAPGQSSTSLGMTGEARRIGSSHETNRLTMREMEGAFDGGWIEQAVGAGDRT